jgi:hypothetical protein
LDYTARNLSIGRGFATRFTIEGVFGSRRDSFQSLVSPIFIFTVDQVYQKPDASRQPYIGGGIGFYSGPLGRQTGSGFLGPTYEEIVAFGGRVFVGGDFTSTTGLEAAVHFTQNTTLATVQLRLKL